MIDCFSNRIQIANGKLRRAERDCRLLLAHPCSSAMPPLASRKFHMKLVITARTTIAGVTSPTPSTWTLIKKPITSPNVNRPCADN
jgi:hypothetical protein